MTGFYRILWRPMNQIQSILLSKRDAADALPLKVLMYFDTAFRSNDNKKQPDSRFDPGSDPLWEGTGLKNTQSLLSYSSLRLGEDTILLDIPISVSIVLQLSPFINHQFRSSELVVEMKYVSNINMLNFLVLSFSIYKKNQTSEPSSYHVLNTLARNG